MPLQKQINKAGKNSLLSIRISEQQKNVISQAAALQNTTISEFVLENAYEAAAEVLADKTHFVLSPEKWEEFCKALDAPPRDLPGIRKLFNKPSVFNE